MVNCIYLLPTPLFLPLLYFPYLQGHFRQHQFSQHSLVIFSVVIKMDLCGADAFAATRSSVLSLKRAYPFGTEEQNDPHTSASSTPSAAQHANETCINSVSEKNTCFGSIIDVKVQLYNMRRPSQSRSRMNDSVGFFAVVQEGDYFTLEHDGDKFGRLNKGLCRHLHELVSMKSVCIQACELDNGYNAETSSPSCQSPTHLLVDISIYGARTDAKDIGDLLSKSNIFLQMPRHRLEGVEYYNPHILRIEGYLAPASIEPLPSSSKVGFGSPESPNRTEETRTNDTAGVDSILDWSLSHHNILQEITIVPGIKSTLLPHQKQAIDFVFRREMEQISSELSLWEYNDIDADEPFYQHVFTGAKQPQPTEAKGGIIADEMGLGKSLVILSTIAGSTGRAEDFVATEDQQRPSQPLEKRASRATLILAPSSLLIDNWVDEIRKHTHPGTLPFYKYLGPERHREINQLREQPIVFTTYATMAAEFHRGDSALAKFKWFRIVLDEAHEIRNRSTKQFQAIASISALHRWCLTGTPIQNSLEDLGALVSFLKVPILENPPTFRKFITKPISSRSRSRFQNLQTLLRTVCLRRTRNLLDLPKPIPKLRKLPFTYSEQMEYQDLLAQGRTEIDMAVSRRGKSNINSVFLESILKLRLFCNNGRTDAVLRAGPTGLPVNPDEALIYLQQHDQDICAYCSGTIYFINEEAETDGGIFISSCHHLICHNCIPHHRAMKQHCPTCTTNNESISQTILPLSSVHTGPVICDENNKVRRTDQYPSKLLALLSDIQKNSAHKSIVFSCWKKTLCLVEKLLHSHGIRCVMIDGSLPLAQRVKVLKDFRSLSGANILLMTLGTGAVGLNLAIASHIYLLEPQWNPSIESQAIGRALRLGQTAEVVITRYIMIGTIEESNILSRQQRKLELAGGGFNKRKDMQPERLQALQDVFGINQELIR
ncbi:SNF2 family N-terminal domain-containing protein [Annulohypoxylon truncatum]|uniref:SNF2 family N-terminal domain-containing protein n=1 Tax=Annulohypoxylon truncatum TaxID=327061 RepID=UPI0020073ED1|nr:SNF2 family N-terminal domain-containing protein [Annulohypoxylon truncatum]KAI1205005.1 SNF2 family N-terminal domain-containing protein [Annulohypoxylon truncatum]